jgi:hypothetical protein
LNTGHPISSNQQIHRDNYYYYLILKYNSKIEELEDGLYYCGDEGVKSTSEIYILKNIVKDLKQVLELEIIK